MKKYKVKEKIKKSLYVVIMAALLVFMSEAEDIVDNIFDTFSNRPEQSITIQGYKKESDMELNHLNKINYSNVKSLNNNRTVPIEINKEDISEVQTNISQNKTYEYYGNLDKLNRVTIAKAYLDKSLMPKDKRGDIMNVKPTGWKNKKYKNVSGGWLYNRSHLIGFQLSGENDNWKNLMTGTRQMNTDMIPIENKVANYIKSNPNNKVYYRVIPKFIGNNLVADGIEIFAVSNLDKNIDILFKVYIPNTQEGIQINYSDGSSRKI